MKTEIEQILSKYSIDEVLTALADYYSNLAGDDTDTWLYKLFEKKLRKLAVELGDL